MSDSLAWWDSLRHWGMLITPARLPKEFPDPVEAPSPAVCDLLRREINRVDKPGKGIGSLLDVVFEKVCGMSVGWLKHPNVGREWEVRLPDKQTLRPDRVWQLEG
ncbi:MAG: hypothetical protein WCO96_10205, partial [Actinomycetes bacterium]